jgi:hypothetical protein
MDLLVADDGTTLSQCFGKLVEISYDNKMNHFRRLHEKTGIPYDNMGKHTVVPATVASFIGHVFLNWLIYVLNQSLLFQYFLITNITILRRCRGWALRASIRLMECSRNIGSKPNENSVCK